LDFLVALLGRFLTLSNGGRAAGTADKAASADALNASLSFGFRAHRDINLTVKINHSILFC
jgi:hypothetical protein